MSDKTPPRPSQATFGGWLVVSGSVFVVASQFGTVATLRSLDTRQQVESALAEPPFDGLGLSVSGALSILHVLALVAGGCAAAMAVLGVYALRRHRASRVALSVLAVPLLLTGFVTGGLLASVVVVAVVMLWLQPSRDWFDGVTRRVEPERQKVPAGPPSGTGSTGAAPDGGWRPPATGPGASAGRAHEGYGGPPQPWGQPWQAGPGQGPTGGGVPTRPRGVVVACVLTWVFSGLTALLLAAAAIGVWADPGLIMDEVRRLDPDAVDEAGLTEGMLVGTMAGMAAVGIVWSVAASVLAVLAFRRSSGARIGLVVSSGLVSFVLLVMSFGAFPLVLPLMASVATLALLLRPEANRWYAARG